MSEIEKRSPIGLRVFRRLEDKLIIFWSTERLTEEQKDKTNAEVQIKHGSSWTKIKCLIAMSDELRDKYPEVQRGVMIAIINHKENSMNPEFDCLIKVKLGKTSVVESVKQIFPLGVLPDEEKDSKKQHIQHYGWEKKKKCWVKIAAIELEDGSYALATASVPEKVKK